MSVLVVVLSSHALQAQVTFLDVSSVTAGGPGAGTFTGSLGAITVTGSITALGGPASFFFNGATPGLGGAIGDSTIDNLSPQYSYPTIYSSTLPGTDRIGWSSLGLKTEQIVITFSAPVTNPVFHVANIDWAQFAFVGLPGLTSIAYLSGNGGGDGLDTSAAALALLRVQDFDPTTADGTPPGLIPPVAGPRSGYGSIQLNGTFTTIFFGAGTAGPFSDVGGGSFTISVPEPGTWILIGATVVAVCLYGWHSRLVKRRLLNMQSGE